MLNKVMIIGHLGRDPEVRYTQTGAPIAHLNIATSESYNDRDGNKVDRTEWHRVVVFQRAAENCQTYLKKGSLVFVEGNLQTRKWQDQQGQDRYSTEIRAQRVQFLDRRGDAAGGGGEGNFRESAPRPGGQNRPPQRQPGHNEYDDIGPAFPSEAGGMDDVPF